MKKYYVYFMMSQNNRAIYVGVTNNLIKRIYAHKNKLVKGFTAKYNICKLVYWEEFNDPMSAISREKQIKGGSRQDKVDLIKNKNVYFKDLYQKIV